MLNIIAIEVFKFRFLTENTILNKTRLKNYSLTISAQKIINNKIHQLFFQKVTMH